MKKAFFTRNFALLVLGQASSLLGNYTLKFALSMYVLEATGSASVFAALLSAAMVPTILLSPFGGMLADRVNRRTIMVALDALSGLAVFLAWLLLPSGGSLAVIGALLIALSILGAFESPTVQACIPQMLDGEQLIRGNAVINQVQSIAALVTPFLGSFLYAAFGLQPIFYAAVACFFLTAGLECFIRLPWRKPEAKCGISAAVRADFSRSMHFLRREQPGILKLLLLAALVSLFVAGTAVVGFPYLVRTVLGLSAQLYGAAESAMGVASIVGSLGTAVLARRLRLRNCAWILAAFGICLVPCALAFALPLGAMARYAVLLIMFCLCQMGCSFFSTYAISVIQARTPEGLMGKVMSYVFTLSLCAQPLGQMLYGALFDAFAQQVYWVLLPTGLLVAGIGLASAGFFRRLEGEPGRNGALSTPQAEK